ncbi:hypothetical protein KKF05_02785 [Patescibacteria group bacterium]|nr:hypothetical protein [Patescibacteria group bacterium]MBU1029364.1 hypothetical protein [Patescibacteria group bacterium]MBU1915577.1 hypothetical protein [Patescibacteria group bacterium]
MQQIIVGLQLLQNVSFFAFALSFVAMLVANHYVGKQKFGSARRWTLVSAISANVVLAFEVAAFVFTLSPFAGFMILVWGYFSYFSWKRYGELKNL